MLLTHQLWREAHPVSVLSLHPHWLPTTWDPKPGQEGMSPWQMKDMGGRADFPSPPLSPQWVSCRLEAWAGRETRPGGWQCGKAWTTSTDSTSQLNQFRVIWKNREASHPFSLQSSSWKCQDKCWLARGWRMRASCAVLKTKQQVKPYSSRTYRRISTNSSKSPAGRQLAWTGLGSFRKLQNRVNNNKQK